MHVAASTGRVVAGRYLLQHPIGRGAMGTVWRAQDSLLARDVAVKEVRLRSPLPNASGSPGGPVTEETRVLYERTLREARTAARLNHPAVITVFDVIEEANGCPWIVMELIQGRSLEQIVAEDGPLPPLQAADLGGRLLSALRCAHAAGILHRDVKPSNVLLGAGGRAVLTDFGIATLEGDSTLTQAGMVMGTPGFTAPERVRGEPASPASDLWSLGATLFAAVEGHGLFDDRRTSLAILAAIANEEPPRPRRAGPLRPAVEALLRRDAWARPDAATAARMLAAAQEGSSPADPGPPGQPDGAATTQVPLGHHPDQPEPRLLSPADEPDGTLASPVPAWGGEPGWAAATPEWADRRPGDRRPAARHGATAGPGLAQRLPAGLRDWLDRTPRWLLATLAGLLIVAAGLLAGLAFAGGGAPGVAAGPGGSANSTGSATPYRSYTGPGTATSPGFTLRLPAGWQTTQRGQSSYFLSPDRTVSVVVYPVPAGLAGMLAQGQLLRLTEAKQHAFPGYQGPPTGLHAVHLASGSGVSWTLAWQPPGRSRREVMETLLHPVGAPVTQRFVIQEIAPAAGFRAAEPAFAAALRSFRVHPRSGAPGRPPRTRPGGPPQRGAGRQDLGDSWSVADVGTTPRRSGVLAGSAAGRATRRGGRTGRGQGET
jgi:eukaryotic-like serine/threonine-protein kinase